MSDAKYEKNGFSLVEVLLVIAIVGILIAVTTPNWISSRSVELSGASLEMGAFFEQASLRRAFRNTRVAAGSNLQV